MADYQTKREALLEGLSGKKREVTAQLLDNQNRINNELMETVGAGVTGTANFARFDKVVGPLIRRVAPATIAMELVGVQPLNGPTGLVRTMRVRYSGTQLAGSGPAVNEEARGVSVYEKYSLIARGEAYTASDARTAEQIMLALEADGGNEMNIEVIKQTVTAKSRKLQAKWTIEADQDSKALDGLNLEQELVAALSDEIIRELDREILGDLTVLAGTVKAFDFATADGRYAGEKFAALSIGVSDLSSQIAVKTKRGGASWMVVSPNVLVALRHASNGAFVPATASGDLSPSTSLFVGTMNGNIRVFVDIYASADTMILGYKGSSDWDSGYIYSPYIPLMQSQVVTDPDTFDPRIGLMTRYATTTFTDSNTSLGNSADYYARGTIANLALGF